MGLFDRAICFAVARHSGQVRKGAGTPYIVHPLEAAAIVGSMTNDEEVLAATVLHDTVEDAGVTHDELIEYFGKRVALLVMTETEDKRVSRPAEETWEIRKEETLMILENTKDIGVKMMWLGDKLSNVRSFYRMYLKEGNDLWQKFHQKDPRRQKWYYYTVAKYLSALSEYDAYKEYMRLIDIIFENVK